MGAFLRDVAQSIRMLRERRGFGASSGDFFDGRRGTADAGVRSALLGGAGEYDWLQLG